MTAAALEQARAMIGQPVYPGRADTSVSAATIRAMCAAVENANPVYWDRQAARDIVGLELAPATMLSTWGRPELWTPHAGMASKPLQLHFDLKALFGYPVAIVRDFESVFHTPVAVGESLFSCQVLRSVSELKATRLGRGRFWEIEVQYRDRQEALVGTDSFNCFGYRKCGA